MRPSQIHNSNHQGPAACVPPPRFSSQKVIIFRRTDARTDGRTDKQPKNDTKNPDTNGETSLKKSHFDAFLAVSDNFSVIQKGGSFEHFFPLPRPIFMAKKQVKRASIIDFK